MRIIAHTLELLHAYMALALGKWVVLGGRFGLGMAQLYSVALLYGVLSKVVGAFSVCSKWLEFSKVADTLLGASWASAFL